MYLTSCPYCGVVLDVTFVEKVKSYDNWEEEYLPTGDIKCPVCHNDFEVEED